MNCFHFLAVVNNASMNICVLGKVVALFYIPTRMYEVSSFSTFLPTFVIICFSNIDVGCWMRNVIVILICISPITNDVGHIFLCLLAIHTFSLKRSLYSDSLSIF